MKILQWEKSSIIWKMAQYISTAMRCYLQEQNGGKNQRATDSTHLNYEKDAIARYKLENM